MSRIIHSDVEPKFKKLEDLGLGMDEKFKHIVDSTDAKIANLKSGQYSISIGNEIQHHA